MTNQELYEQIKELRQEMKDCFQKQQEDHQKLHKEFYVFKGKALGFLSFLSVIFSYAIDYIKGHH